MTYPYLPPPVVSTPGPTAAEIAAVVAILEAHASEATTTANALSRLWNYTIDPRAIAAALAMADHAGTRHRGTRHAPRLRGTGAAARSVQSNEINYRAAFIIAAARRIDADLRAGQTMAESMRDERRFYAMHELARRMRQRAAIAVDAAADKYGAVLGWHAHLDDRTTPECLAADGHNFRAAQMPRIGYPGSVHPKCRCWPGPPFASISTVDEVTFGVMH